MSILEKIPSDAYPALYNAFVSAVENAILPQEHLWQLICYPDGALPKLKTQNERQELSLHRWVGMKGNLKRVSIVVRQNQPDTEPYLYNAAKRRSKWDKDKRRRANLSSPVLG